MTLFRGIRKRRPSRLDRILAGAALEDAMARAQQPAGEEMPPRPARQPYRSLGPDTTPKLAFGMGPVDPEFDPCGKQYPPLKTDGDEKGAVQ